MSYIGSTPTSQAFASGTDTFSGTGSQTVFTLSRNVASVNDILVIVNNVEQQPNTYSVAGNILTFSGPPSSGSSNVYVRYLSTNIQTIGLSQGVVGASQLSATGTPSSSTYLRGDNAWASIPTAAQILPITASVASNALTITLNPTTLDFRSSSLTSGTINTRTVSSPISVTVSSGSTLGTINATQSKLVVIALDNAGTVELAVVNIAGGNQLDETTLISTTAEGGAGAADSINVVYSTTARTNVPYRVVGYVESTQTTAGTWATAPSTIQGAGGQALDTMGSLGYSQTWQTVTRSSGTTYYNTTGRPIVFTFTANLTQVTTVTIGGANAVTVGAQPYVTQITVVVPPGMSYSATSAQAGLGNPRELR